MGMDLGGEGGGGVTSDITPGLCSRGNINTWEWPELGWYGLDSRGLSSLVHMIHKRHKVMSSRDLQYC